jgi:hypothetical protein
MPDKQVDDDGMSVDRRRDEILRNLLHMPPEQHKEIKAKRVKQRKSRDHSFTK